MTGHAHIMWTDLLLWKFSLPISKLESIKIFHTTISSQFNSLAPGKCEWNFRYIIFKHISVIDGWGISCEIALIRMSLDFADDQSTLVQVMAWCRQATSHYLSQCWPRSMSKYGVIHTHYWRAIWELFAGKKMLQVLFQSWDTNTENSNQYSKPLSQSMTQNMYNDICIIFLECYLTEIINS